MDIKNPFSSEDKKKVDDAIAELNNIESLIKRGEIAGLNMQDAKEKAAKVKEKLQQLKRGFFPNS